MLKDDGEGRGGENKEWRGAFENTYHGVAIPHIDAIILAPREGCIIYAMQYANLIKSKAE